MKSETHDPSRPDDMSVVVRRAALTLVCVALFAIFGLAAPYKIYKHYKSQPDAASALTTLGRP
ncbi:MAG: hypothetical protein EPO10_25900 [Reyranella sp.]|uniref:hypothetical protein n=1 Tax=Reyranella sp. TaxID=1929291 RepID=UPI001223154E|nr:hypothetical protein [Reyranella sp.]TAJ96932.1 MAG: hypothetical protein EPO41_05260 [Reyranella sp.]TBR24148.1 MAG: hypothetical protein EPO10_25900 [Reyranella sp.]